MQTFHKKYAVRSGTLDSGREYEYKMIALLSLRCFLEDPEDVWIASNADYVGAFDDIILRIIRTSKDDSTYMLQLKHKDNSKNITEAEFLSSKGDFSLIKYSNDLAKLKHSCELKKFGIVSDLGDFNTIIFALFTNRGVTEYDCLNKICNNNNNNNYMSILNTNKNSFKLFKFNYSKCGAVINNDNCQNLHLIANQISNKQLNQEISLEIKKIAEKFELTNVNVKFVTEKFIMYIFEWAKGNLGDHYYLTKRDIYCKLTELFFCQYEVEFIQEEFNFYLDDDKKNIWNTIISDKLLTIVDMDENILKFLKQYIGSEVKKYLQEEDVVKLWVDNISEQAQSFFYQGNDDLKIEMLKIVGNHGKITFNDIYKCLWLARKLPLLLQANNVQEYENIVKIMKLSNSNLKVIVVNVTLNSLPVKKQNFQEYFLNLNDIKSEERDVVLSQLVLLQGRSLILLNELINEDIYEEIKCKDVINILSGNFNIGNKYNPVSDCFIKRTLSKVYIKTEALKNIKDELFLIQNPHQVTNIDLEEFGGNVIIATDEEEDEQIKRLKSEGEIIHRLILHPDYLEWKETFGRIENIQQYYLNGFKKSDSIIKKDSSSSRGESDLSCKEDLIQADNKLNTACVISANPGMGKSTFLNYVATQGCDNKWTIKVNLNDHHDYYEAIKQASVPLGASDHLMYFFQKNNRSKLTEMVFKKFLGSKNILVLLDGFDEISIPCKDEVTQIAKSLQKEDYRVWITTRPVMKSYLEERLNTLALSIEPFTLSDQTNFLTKYFSEFANNSNQELIADFVLKLLKAAQVNLNDDGLEFTANPLHTMLLADLFSRELQNFLSTGIINLERKFDLLYLYEEFIKRKNKILYDKFGIGSKNMRMVFEEHQQLFALELLFGEKIQELNIWKQLKTYYEDHPENIQFLQLEGVLVVEGTFKSLKITFVHQTFAEYLAALWLSRNINNKDVEVKKIVKTILKVRFCFNNYFYSFLINLFDCLIAKKSKAHLAIIHDRLNELEDMIKINPDIVDSVDNGGRTVLHMLAIYGRNYDSLDCNANEEDKILGIVKKITNVKITNITDYLGYTALDYAVAFWNLSTANKLCEKSQFIKIGPVEDIFRDQYFELCAHYNFKLLFKVLFLHFACKKVLFLRWAKTETIESFCKTRYKACNPILIDFAKDFGATTLGELFQFETMNDLRFTAINGNKDLLNLLLSKGADVNATDIFNNTPLHYSVRHKRLDMVKLLVSKGAEIDKQGKRGCTALHYATEIGCNNIVKQLLLNGADINKENNKGDTALHMASYYYRKNTLKLLIEKGAKANLKNKSGKIPLHDAVTSGSDKVVFTLLKSKNNSTTVNCQTNKGETPLHYLTFLCVISDDQMKECKKMVYLLLKAGADVNLQDKNGNTPLHYLCKTNYYLQKRVINIRKFTEQFRLFIFELFLKNGANINLKNKEGKSVWDSAIDNNRTDFIALLERYRNNSEETICPIQNLRPPRTKLSQLNCIL